MHETEQRTLHGPSATPLGLALGVADHQCRFAWRCEAEYRALAYDCAQLDEPSERAETVRTMRIHFLHAGSHACRYAESLVTACRCTNDRLVPWREQSIASSPARSGRDAQRPTGANDGCRHQHGAALCRTRARYARCCIGSQRR
jgi:hypothetical protein